MGAKHLIWVGLAILAALYVLFAATIGFEGPMALTIHFVRIFGTSTVVIIYLSKIRGAFEVQPPLRSDYLLTGIVCTFLSSVGFSLLNEAHRIWPDLVDNDIFTGAIAGFCSLLLCVGAGFFFLTPNVGGVQLRRIAIVLGVLLGVWLVLIAPYFRAAH